MQQELCMPSDTKEIEPKDYLLHTLKLNQDNLQENKKITHERSFID